MTRLEYTEGSATVEKLDRVFQDTHWEATKAGSLEPIARRKAIIAAVNEADTMVQEEIPPALSDALARGRKVLDLPLQTNDQAADTIGGYLTALLSALWAQGEGFSGKRPFGESGWQSALYRSLVLGGLVDGTIDEYGLSGVDADVADRMILDAIEALGWTVSKV